MLDHFQGGGGVVNATLSYLQTLYAPINAQMFRRKLKTKDIIYRTVHLLMLIEFVTQFTMHGINNTIPLSVCIMMTLMVKNNYVGMEWQSIVMWI